MDWNRTPGEIGEFTCQNLQLKYLKKITFEKKDPNFNWLCYFKIRAPIRFGKS